jgi:FtsZ-binding cell division protein ZapB
LPIVDWQLSVICIEDSARVSTRIREKETGKNEFGSIENQQSKIGNYQGEHMTDTNNQFERLEEKMLKAIELFKRTQAEKRTLQQENEKLKAEIKEHAQGNSALDRELIALRKEREDVRTRVEKLLERIDLLTTPDTEG